MEQPCKKLTRRSILLLLLIMLPLCLRAQYAPKASSATAEIKSPAAQSLRKTAKWTMIAAPIATASLYGVMKMAKRTKVEYCVDLYESPGLFLRRITGLTLEEADYYAANPPDPATIGVRNFYNVEVPPYPTWVPWAVGGTAIAIGGIMYGLAGYMDYKYRVEINKRTLAINVRPDGIIITF